MVGAILGANEVDKTNQIVYNKDLYRRNTMKETHGTLKNITNITNINTLTNIKNLKKENNELTSSTSVGGVKVPLLEPKVGVGREAAHLPGKWRSAKFDLFNNATDDDLIKGKYNYTLSLHIFKYNQSENDKIFNCKAKLNRTNLDLFNSEIDKSGSHYRTCRGLRDKIIAEFGQRAQHISLNKFYQANFRGGKAKIIDGLSAILIRTVNEHHLVLIYKDQSYAYQLSNLGISNKARQAGCIGSLYVMNNKPDTYKKINLDDEGL